MKILLTLFKIIFNYCLLKSRIVKQVMILIITGSSPHFNAVVTADVNGQNQFLVMICLWSWVQYLRLRLHCRAQLFDQFCIV